MSTLRNLAGIATGLAVWVSALGGSADPRRTVGAQAIEREMFVSVLDEKEIPVPDLGVNEFIVREDGVQREVLRVSRATAPMQLAILVDTSRAAIPTIPDIRRGVHAFLEGMHDRNELSLITFGGPPRILVESTRDREQLKAGIDRVFGSSDTGAYLLDALTETVRGFRKREASRPAMVVVTTDGTDFSNRTHTDVLEILGESGVAMHALVLPSDKEAQSARRFGVAAEPGRARTQVSQDPTFTEQRLRNETMHRDFVLARGTKATGGRLSDLLTSMSLKNELTAVAAEFSNQYLVVYARPQTLIPPKQIEVSTRRANLSARGTPARVVRGG